MAYVDADQAESVTVTTPSDAERLREATVDATCTVTDSLVGYTILGVAYSESLGIAAAMLEDKLVDADAATVVSILTASDGQLTLEAVIATLVRIGFVLPVSNAVSDVWVMNLDNGMFSRYADYAFNSFGKFDGRVIGAKDDGLYLLDGDDDDGTVIQSMVDFGRLDFATLQLKHISNVYVGVSSDGVLHLKVIAAGEEYVYAARTYNEETKTQRFDLGKGLRTNYYDFELYGDGARFDLTDIEFVEIPSTRRI